MASNEVAAGTDECTTGQLRQGSAPLDLLAAITAKITNQSKSVVMFMIGYIALVKNARGE